MFVSVASPTLPHGSLLTVYTTWRAGSELCHSRLIGAVSLQEQRQASTRAQEHTREQRGSRVRPSDRWLSWVLRLTGHTQWTVFWPPREEGLLTRLSPGFGRASAVFPQGLKPFLYLALKSSKSTR